MWHRTVGSLCSFFSRPADPSPLGAGSDLGYFGYSDCGAGLYEFLCSLFLARKFRPAPLARVVPLLRVFALPLTHSRPAPLTGDMAVVFVDVFPVSYG